MKQSSPARAFWYAFFFTLSIIAAHMLGVLKSIERMSASAINPLATASFHSARNIADAISGLHVSASDLQKENDALHAQLIGYTAVRARAAELTQENASLLNLLHYTASVPHAIAAQIVSAHTDASIESMVIDRGSEDGVQAGDPVIAEQGVLAGVILNVREHSAIIELITDNQSQIAASIVHTDRTIGIATGHHGISVTVEMIPQNENINADDTVITSGLESRIPRGLLIGTVESVAKDPSQPFQSARVALPYDLNKLIWVAVLSK